ncbi:unnamed protein product [Parnassius mnemosyne]|uniref:Uncharacterized protein n=1 Tax=Parnassius mnemosyne TaxID=213953 RepID=A0AAV1M310_9NEOP
MKPRAVFGEHTHHGCLLHHSYEYLDNKDFWEYSVPSFSWRNRPDPKYMLVSISPDNYATNKCGLPKKSTIALTAIIIIFCLIIAVSMKRTIGRGFMMINLKARIHSHDYILQ